MFVIRLTNLSSSAFDFSFRDIATALYSQNSVTVIIPNLDGGFKFGSRFYRNYVYHNYGVTEGV